MSTYYDLVCVEHGEALGFHWNHGGDQLAVLAKSLDTWAGVDPALVSEILNYVNWMAEQGPSLEELIEYARRHRGCTVKPKDEYGRWFDQCQERIRCSECGKSDNCVLDNNHEGSCRRNHE